MKDLNNISDEEFDDVFRQSANEHNEELWEDAWPLMNNKLDQEEKKRRFVVFWRWAAALFLFGALGVMSLKYFKSDQSLATQTEIKENTKSQNNNIKKDNSTTLTKEEKKSNIEKEEQPGDLEKAIEEKNNYKNPYLKTEKLLVKSNLKTKSELSSKKKYEPDIKQPTEINLAITENKSIKKEEKFEENNYKNNLENSTETIANQSNNSENTKTNLNETESTFFEEDTIIVAFEETTISSENELFEELPIANSNSSTFRNFGFILGFSPDYSKVSSNAFGPMGHNIQILINYNLTKKIALKAGIIKSLKLYDAYPENYAWPAKWGTPSSPLKEVSATCSMLDIPVVLSYDIKEKGPNKFYTSLGVTSYKMMNEKYIYHYENDNDPNLKWKKWEGSTGFFGAGVIDLSLGLERKIGKKLSFQVEPFVKIPMKNIGFGNVKLYTSGLFFNIKTSTR
ncbi:hypothetical protein EGI22_20985 [Lacihabitans sp. LS3-19]|uniref:hypothetical protein n=1 Tax=Lacihabitans sp. LS3-19 TaxID=2487335 RepID=UPI0020CE6662|nr:hypothetical protein [Lacihabitans sp. LS3-19]MCP9770390.1 hypothetical protein [Lacihabitans sp. LS3-19]